ncbi:type I polyketide synthase [Actinoallomurus sp. NPDC050550]|uniref:type I polyketide synthase n=1 Tax=Actinoallomurus sp. NPDC050550 TaxID=3154937 RepID=UPI0033C9A09E
MSDQATSTVKQALITIKRLQARLDAEARSRTEPIAITGMGCRLPGGVTDPDGFWQLLDQRVDAVGEVPAGRWGAPDGEAVPRRDPARWGAFLEDVDRFDAAFFGISPREAETMDPQQRLLLEVAWEALERAGQTPRLLTGSRTGVFVGVVVTDYDRLCAGGARDIYTVTGNGHSFPAGRLSYVLGLEGPSMTVDTACSSSLVAVHLACQSLRSGESTLALAGGVNLMLTPDMSRMLAAGQALSPDGRCRTFDAQANGYVRGEGCGVLILKRLSAAVADGDPVLAVIRGSAVNQDGRSAGLTAPNVSAQKDLLCQALANARVHAADIGYVETHGTGTPLGDPIEVEALTSVLGAPREDAGRCVLGAVKTNIGHLEAAAGVAGVIKTVLAMRRERIPANLHLRTRNPRIDLSGTPFLLPAEPVDWPRSAGHPRLAGVSSFGISGTNAHVILEEAPDTARPAASPDTERTIVVPISARDDTALRELAGSYAALLTAPPDGAAAHDEVVPGLADIAYTAAVRRHHHERRAAFTARSREHLAELAGAFATGLSLPGVADGRARGDRAQKVVFVFPGQGAQWTGMGRELLATEPVFRAAIEACDDAIRRETGWSLIEELHAPEDRSRLERIDVVQPVLFAMSVALAALWRSWGVEPDAVVGHSMGEVAAAHVAGALTLDDAVRVVCRRSGLLRRLAGRGAMALVELPMAEAQSAVSRHADRLSVAAANSPRSTVVSGDPDAVRELLDELAKAGVFGRHVKVEVASHSPQVEPLLEELRDTLTDIRPMTTRIPMRSTVTGTPCDGNELDAGYWARNLRDPVLFSSSVRGLLDDGHALFVELSPHPVLTPAVDEEIATGGHEGITVASSRRHGTERQVLSEALAALYAHGCPVDWEKYHAAGGRCVPLPVYPWQRERYWVAAGAGTDRPRQVDGHPLLGPSVGIASLPGTRIWQRELTPSSPAYLADHRVEGEVVLPAAAFVEAALAAAGQTYGPGPHLLTDVRFERMAVLPRDGSRTVQLVLERHEDDASFRFFGRTDGDENWTRHAAGTVLPASAVAPPARGERPDDVRGRCPVDVPSDRLYRSYRDHAIDYGAGFQGVQRLWLGSGEALGLIRLPEDPASSPAEYLVHPAMLDACFQVLGGLLLGENDTGAFVPVGLERLRLHRRPTERVWVHARPRHAPAEEDTDADLFTGDLRLIDNDGHVLADVERLSVRRLTSASTVREPYEDWLYRLEWRPAGTPGGTAVAPADGPWLVLSDRSGVGEALTALLDAQGVRCVRVMAGAAYRRLETDAYEIDPEDARSWTDLLDDAFGGGACAGIVHLWSLDAGERVTAETLSHDQRLGGLSVLRLVQAVVRAGWRNTPRLWLVTRDAHDVVAEDGLTGVSQAPLWGFARTLAMEHPEFATMRIDLHAGAEGIPAAERLAETLAESGDEDEMALRTDGRYVARLVRASFEDTYLGTRPRPAVGPGTYLISGGMGGLGLEVAQWLADRGAARLVLMGRSEPAPKVLERVERIQAAGAEVVIARGDVSRRTDVARVLAGIDDGGPPLRGVVHMAMVLDDRTVLELDAERYERVMAPKALGAWNLHELTRDRPLDLFVLYSSAATVLGSPGQAGYAAANAFLGALARHRRRAGLPAVCVDWGLYATSGIMADRSLEGERLSALGVTGIEPREGMEILGRLLRSAPPQIAAVRLNLRQWMEFYPAAAGSALLSELGREIRDPETGTPSQPEGRARLAAAMPEEVPALVEELVGEQLGRILHLAPDRIDRQGTFADLGMDSLMTLELRNRIEAVFGIRLAVSALFGSPTVAALAERLVPDVTEPRAARESRAPDAPPAGSPAGSLDELSMDELLDLIDGSTRGIEGSTG